MESNRLGWEVVSELEVQHVGSYLMQMNVPGDGAQRFNNFTTEIVSEAVRTYLMALISEVDLKVRINTLIINDEI